MKWDFMNALVRTVLRTVTVAVDCCLAWRTIGSAMAETIDGSMTTSSTTRAGISTANKASKTTAIKANDGRMDGSMMISAVLRLATTTILYPCHYLLFIQTRNTAGKPSGVTLKKWDNQKITATILQRIVLTSNKTKISSLNSL